MKEFYLPLFTFQLSMPQAILQFIFWFLLFSASMVFADDGEDLSGYIDIFAPVVTETPVTKPVENLPVVTPSVPEKSPIIQTPITQTNAVDLPHIHPAIPLLDENGQHVLDSQKPYSSRASCGGSAGCHDIDKISRAYHFEMGRDESDDKFGLRRGLAALTSPAYFGGYSCENGNNPSFLSRKTTTKEADFLDYGAVGLIKNCEECHAGGGFSEKDRTGKRYDKQPENAVSFLDGDYFEWNGKKLEQWDWQKSGVIEPDCMMCHTDFSKSKRPVAEWKAQRLQLIKEGEFRFVNSALFAFLNTSPDSENGQTLATLETPQNAEPVLHWNEAAFNTNGDAQIPMLRYPASENCMICHHTSEERRGFYGFGDAAKIEYNEDFSEKFDHRDDVHKGQTWTEKGTARQIENCNACHAKNYYTKALELNADHQFLTGFSAQDIRRDLNFQPKPLSCEHCHGGKEFGSNETPNLPYSGLTTLTDAHRELWRERGDMAGYPENSLNRTVQIHFDKVACQTCHITKLSFQDTPLKPRYRYRIAEDGRLKIMPYNPASRYYWIDSTNQRVLTRAERLEITGGVDSEPKTYQDVKNLKNVLMSCSKRKVLKVRIHK
jgi:hypothetical protein